MSEQKRKIWMQCPGCFSAMLAEDLRPDGWQECDCGEKLTIIDLRERWTDVVAVEPRTFTLAWVAKNGRRTWRVVDARFGGPEDEYVKVVEKAPMLAELQAAQERATDARQDHKEALAERERMLDLLEAAEKEISTRTMTHVKICALLREHGRLPKEER